MVSGIKKKESAKLPTEYGEFTVHVYEYGGLNHLAIVKGAFGMPYRRCFPFKEMRLPAAARQGVKADCQKKRHPHLSEAGRPRYRVIKQDQGIQASGWWHGYRPGK